MKKFYSRLTVFKLAVAGILFYSFIIIFSLLISPHTVTASTGQLDVLSSWSYFGGSALNLTAEGTSDWIQWEGPACSNFNNKSAGKNQISTVMSTHIWRFPSKMEKW